VQKKGCNLLTVAFAPGICSWTHSQNFADVLFGY